MGDVYSAYDPRLDRKVALKLLREAAESGRSTARAANQERLLREAQSTARLSHRNVVTVYDAGTIEDQTGGARVFVAMELVDGQTLSAWLAERRRPWREIRDLFVSAGEGLLAAHEGGLVHRDFKPQNVMVGRDGTIRVMDFGLAGDGFDSVGGNEPPLDLSSSTPPTSQTIALTHTGVLLGTPLYMAPEQFLGRKTNARTDQFAFCVALYEALYGERPFPANTFAELVAAVSAGRVREVPRRASVPAFLGRILLKGLRPDPDSRFTSMRALLAALVANPLRHRRGVAVGAAVTVALLATVAGAHRIASRGQRMCRGATTKLEGIWELDEGGPRRNAVHSAFIASGSPLVEDTWPRVATLLDNYFRGWTAAYTDTCEATHLRGDQSAEVLDLRMTCLEGERSAFRALVEVLSHVDPRTVLGAVDAANELPPIDRCADLDQLRAVVPMPSAAAVRARVVALRAELADTKALADTGQWRQAYDKIVPQVAAARSAGYEPVVAETLAVKGWLECELLGYARGVGSYREVVSIALATHQDALAAEAAVQIIGATPQQPDSEDPYWESLGGAMIRRLGHGHERIAAWLHHNKAVAYFRGGKFEDAAREFSLALSLKRSALPPNHPDIARSLSSLAYLRAEMGDGQGALAAAQEALAIVRRAYGDRSPSLWLAIDNRGVALSVLQRYKEAESDLRSSLARATSLVDTTNQNLADPLTDLGKVLLNEGKYMEAEPLLVSAIRILESGDPMSFVLAEARFALARVRWALQKDWSGDRTLAIAALDTYRTSPGFKKWADEVQTWLSDMEQPGAR